MARASVPQQHLKELLLYFSSFLTDALAAVTDLRVLIYELIQLNPPSSHSSPVLPDMTSIANACRKCYDDLKRSQSLLRGHVKAKIVQK